jgi:hypothetical protein
VQVESTPATGTSYFTPATVEIATSGAPPVRKTVTTVHGHADDPLRWPEIADKFRACASFAIPALNAERQARVISLVESLEQVADVGEIARLLAAPG